MKEKTDIATYRERMKINLRKASEGMTDKDIAGVVGVSRSTVSKWMNGNADPTIDAIYKLNNKLINEHGEHPDIAFLLGAQSEWTRSISNICDVTGLSARAARILEDNNMQQDTLKRSVTIGLINYFIEHSEDLVALLSYDIALNQNASPFDAAEAAILEQAYIDTIGKQPAGQPLTPAKFDAFRARVDKYVSAAALESESSVCTAESASDLESLLDDVLLEQYILDRQARDPNSRAERQFARTSELNRIIESFIKSYTRKSPRTPAKLVSITIKEQTPGMRKRIKAITNNQVTNDDVIYLDKKTALKVRDALKKKERPDNEK